MGICLSKTTFPCLIRPDDVKVAVKRAAAKSAEKAAAEKAAVRKAWEEKAGTPKLPPHLRSRRDQRRRPGEQGEQESTIPAKTTRTTATSTSSNEAKADDLGVCERLQAAGSPHVGEATVFVSWFLGTSIATLLDALGQFLKQHDLDPSTTFFWVCDYVIRQTDVGADLKYLGDCVAAIGHTALLLEPWDKPTALGRSYCLKEIIYTQKSGAKFDVVMSEAQQAAFEKALGAGGGTKTIQAAIAAVDVRTAECRNAEDQAAIRSELEAIGASECNALVVGLMREQLARQALAKVRGGAGDVANQPGGGAAGGRRRASPSRASARSRARGTRRRNAVIRRSHCTARWRRMLTAMSNLAVLLKERGS